VSAATAGILGALAGLGVVLVVAGLRRAAEPEPSPRLAQLAARVRQEATMPRVAATLVTMAVVAAVTRWPSGTVLAGLAAWFLPRALGPDREHARALERIEAIASWTEMLRDTISAAAGLEQAILAAEQQARDLAQLLGSLADSARQHAVMRMRVAAGRARVRTAARIIIAVTMVLVVGLLAWSRPFLAPYGTPAGQLMLLVVGACFAAGFWWLHKISVMGDDPRLLVNLGTAAEAGANGARP
jgi:tight adherence protein B